MFAPFWITFASGVLRVCGALRNQSPRHIPLLHQPQKSAHNWFLRIWGNVAQGVKTNIFGPKTSKLSSKKSVYAMKLKT
jgi:hypothetical protein